MESVRFSPREGANKSNKILKTNLQQIPAKVRHSEVIEETARCGNEVCWFYMDNNVIGFYTRFVWWFDHPAEKRYPYTHR